jgi:hypothetical protein
VFNNHGKAIAAFGTVVAVAVGATLSLAYWKTCLVLEVEKNDKAVRLEAAATLLQVEKYDKAVRLEAAATLLEVEKKNAAMRVEVEKNDKAVRLEVEKNDKAVRLEAAATLLEVEKKNAAMRLEAAQKDKEHAVATLLLQVDLARAENRAASQVLDFLGHSDYERLSKKVDSVRAGLVDASLVAGPGPAPGMVTVEAGE